MASVPASMNPKAACEAARTPVAPQLEVSDVHEVERQPTDSELVARARTSDRDACEHLVRRHYGGVFAVALAILRRRDDAEDCCHDAIVRALAHLSECRDPDKFAQWIAAIARNHARNYLASATVRRSEQLDPRTPSAEPSATARIETGELRARLESALSTLSHEQREVVLLHDLGDWPHARIAEWIGSSAGMCRQHLFKARRKLRGALSSTLLQEHRDE